MAKQIVFVFLILIGGIVSLLGQLEPEIKFKLYFDDAIGNKDSVTFGYDSIAKGYIDPAFGEIDISQTPMDSIFEVRGSYSNGYWFQSKISVDGIPSWYCTPSTSSWPLYQAFRISARHWPVTVSWDRAYFNANCIEWTHIMRFGWYVNHPSLQAAAFRLNENSSLILERNYLRQTADIGTYDGANARVELLNNGKKDTIQILWVGISDGPPTGSIFNTTSLTEVKTYPNPAIAQLTIEVPDCNTAMQVSVFNQLGMEVLGQNVNCNNSNGKIDVAQLPVGYYQGMCRLDDGKSYLFRFAKME